MTQKYISVNVENHIATVTIDCPPVNALPSWGCYELRDAIRGVSQRRDVNVVILTAVGKGFCAGVDIKEAAEDKDGSIIAKINRSNRELYTAIYECSVPVIGAIHGFCMGTGIAMAGSCDILIVAENATFAMPEIDRGAMGAATHLTRMFGQFKSRMMFFTGKPINAAEAYRLGAAEKVVPLADLQKEAKKLAESMADKSPLALRFAKESVNGIELLDPKKSYRYEQAFTYELYTSEDSKEARRAFVEKRPPVYKGE
jgi:enoyl-CoA hydratase